MNTWSKLNEYAEKIENELKNYVSKLNNVDPFLLESMAYSLLSGGKRIRSSIMISFYELCGGTSSEIYKFACALEMVHTYSLIHDDLPCMDDDKIRRGKPCNHIKFGENIAILAGDALLTQAFEIMSNSSEFVPKNILRSIYILANAAGSSGMISGQSMDLKLQNYEKTKNKILEIYKLKTGALFSAAAQIGVILAGASEVQIEIAKNYGELFGVYFQLADDVLDKDEDNLKVFKNDETSKTIDNFIEFADEQLDKFNGDANFLKNLTKFLKSGVS